MYTPEEADTVEIPKIADLFKHFGPSAAPVRVTFGGLSHSGKVRANNEDVYIVVRYGRFWQTLTTNLPEGDAPERVTNDGYGFLVADVVGDLPAERAGAELAGAPLRSRRGDSGGLAVEALARSEADDDPAPALGVRDGERRA